MENQQSGPNGKSLFEKIVTTFRVVSVSSNHNSFGLYGHILLNKSGEAFQGARFRRLKKGEDISVPATVRLCTETEPYFEISREYSFGECCFELVESLGLAPREVVHEVFPENGPNSSGGRN